MNNIIMKLEDIDKFYMETGNKLHILKKLNLEVKRGEFVSYFREVRFRKINSFKYHGFT